MSSTILCTHNWCAHCVCPFYVVNILKSAWLGAHLHRIHTEIYKTRAMDWFSNVKPNRAVLRSLFSDLRSTAHNLNWTHRTICSSVLQPTFPYKRMSCGGACNQITLRLRMCREWWWGWRGRTPTLAWWSIVQKVSTRVVVKCFSKRWVAPRWIAIGI